MKTIESIATRRLESRQDYVKNLKLVRNIGHRERASINISGTGSEDLGEAAVVAGNVLCYSPDPTVQQRQDVADSTLFAELAANAVYDKEREPENWYNEVSTVLLNLGWVINTYSFQSQVMSGETVTLDTVALSLMTSIMSGNELTVLTETLEVLGAESEDDKALEIFDSNGSEGEGGSFQLGSCSTGPTGDIQMALGSFFFDSKEHQDRFLWVTWETRNINFYASTQSITLNESIYSLIRETVIERLGDSRISYIANIPLAE